MFKNVIRVAEYERLYYDNEKPFKEKHWSALCRYQEEQYKKGENSVEYFKILNKGIQFTNYVGVIQAGSLTIEILPKTDRNKTTAANETIDKLQLEDYSARQSWHTVLLKMLKECRLLTVNHVDYANLNLKSNSILDIYLELFLAETENLLHQGLVKKYKKEEGNKLTLKGQLQFSKNIAYNLVHQERFYIKHTEYNRNNVFNQLLYKTLRLIPLISSNSYLSDKVNRLLLDFPEMPDCKVTAATFDKLVLDRKTERYKEALLISKMLLLNYRPDITGGNENVIAILFDMNKLWEEFVFRRLKKEEHKEGIIVQRQQSKKFWYSTEPDRNKTIRPDIVIRKGDETIVVDTKWKVIDDLIPSDDDLKQMFVYNLYWACKRSVLLYPANTFQSNEGFYYDSIGEPDDANRCVVKTVNIFDAERRLDKLLGKRLVEQITKIEID